MTLETAPRGKQVLDASALLAYINSELGRDTTEQAMELGTFMSVVNWAEVLTRFADEGKDPVLLVNEFEARAMFNQSIRIEPITPQDCVEIARLRPLTRSFGLGLGDRTCLALAKRLDLPILTADKSWALLDIGVRVHLLR